MFNHNYFRFLLGPSRKTWYLKWKFQTYETIEENWNFLIKLNATQLNNSRSTSTYITKKYTSLQREIRYFDSVIRRLLLMQQYKNKWINKNVLEALAKAN